MGKARDQHGLDPIVEIFQANDGRLHALLNAYVGARVIYVRNEEDESEMHGTDCASDSQWSITLLTSPAYLFTGGRLSGDPLRSRLRLESRSWVPIPRYCRYMSISWGVMGTRTEAAGVFRLRGLYGMVDNGGVDGILKEEL